MKLKKKVVEVIEFSDLLNVSLDNFGSVVGLEIFNASKYFELQNPEINFKEFLSNLDNVEIKQSDFRENWLLLLCLASQHKLVKQQLPPFRKNEYESPLLASV